MKFFYFLIIPAQVLLISKDYVRSRGDTIHDNNKPGAQINMPEEATSQNPMDEPVATARAALSDLVDAAR